jgi:hypothetical protein
MPSSAEVIFSHLLGNDFSVSWPAEGYGTAGEKGILKKIKHIRRIKMTGSSYNHLRLNGMGIALKREKER